MTIRIAVLACSLLLIGVVTTVVYRSTDEEWRQHQSEYYALAMKRASSERLRRAIKEQGLEIKQDSLTGFGRRRVDRCRTCHMAVDDPDFRTGKQPLRTHPPIAPHPAGEFGCTICHGGNGRGLTTRDAHGRHDFWPEPLLDKPYIEASCARCHPEPYLKETPHLRRGRKLFADYACVGCHTVRGLSRGKLGAELSDVGLRLKVAELHQKLQNPKAQVALSIMPTFPMPEADRRDLVVFLKSRWGRSFVESPIGLRRRLKAWHAERPPDVEVTAEAGARAFERRACGACHKLGSRDGQLAPDLSFEGRLRDTAYVSGHIKDPRSHVPGSSMPTFWMSESERQALAAFLAAQTSVEVPADPRGVYGALCARCHGTGGDGSGLVAQNLVPRPREFTNAKYFNWLPESRAHIAILEGVPGTAMPPFKQVLTRGRVEQLFAWIRKTFIKARRVERRHPRKLPASEPGYSEAAAHRGRNVFLKRCSGCHGRLGDGRGPNAADMLPRPRNLRSRLFVGAIDNLRLYESISYGIVGTGMPPWDTLSTQERWDLVYFIRQLSGTRARRPGRNGT